MKNIILSASLVLALTLLSPAALHSASYTIAPSTLLPTLSMGDPGGANPDPTACLSDPTGCGINAVALHSI